MGASDLMYDKGSIEQFLRQNKHLFFPNGEYSEKDIKIALLSYCEELHMKFENNEKKRFKLFNDAGLATGLSCHDMEDWEKQGFPGSKKFTNEMWEATIDTEHYYNALVHFRSRILNRSQYITPVLSFMSLSKSNCLSNCEKLLKDVGYFKKYK